MKNLARVAAALALSCLLALLLSFGPQLNSRLTAKGFAGQSDFSVFSHAREMELTASNVVDFLTRIRLKLPIARVEVSQTMLSVDLRLTQPASEQAAVFDDLFELASNVFTQTGNIDRLFVRVMQRQDDQTHGVQQYLLVAVEADRGDLRSGEALFGNKLSDTSKEQFVRSHFRLTETDRWNRARIDSGRE
jgi:hypothetical protein